MRQAESLRAALGLSRASRTGPDGTRGVMREVTGRGFENMDVFEKPTWTYSRRPRHGTSRSAPHRHERSRRQDVHRVDQSDSRKPEITGPKRSMSTRNASCPWGEGNGTNVASAPPARRPSAT